jgi:hypothetical protein
MLLIAYLVLETFHVLEIKLHHVEERRGFEPLNYLDLRCASAADLTTLLCKTVTKSLFEILNVNASPTLSSNPTNYPGISVVSENWNFETQSKYSTGSNQ